MLTIHLTSVIDSAPPDVARLESLIARVASGDNEAFAALYEATRTAVYAFALSVLRHHQDAEDATQDAFLGIYASAGDYRPRGKPMAWIITVTRNLCLMRLRARRTTAEPTPEDWTDTIPDGSMSFEDRVVMRACMEQLADEERQIVVLHILGGFRHREIAALLALPLSTVLSKYRRALRKLARVLA